MNIWAWIALAILAMALVWWLFGKLYPSTICIGRFESREEAEKYVRDFEAALERDKDKARNFLGRSTL